MDTTEDTAIPDLRDIPPGQLAGAPSGLVRAIALYQERLEADAPLSSFNSGI